MPSKRTGRGWLVWAVVCATAALLWLAAEAPDRRDASTPEPPASPTVYVTESGTRYHRKGCSRLQPGHTAMPLSAVARSHLPCTICRPLQ